MAEFHAKLAMNRVQGAWTAAPFRDALGHPDARANPAARGKERDMPNGQCPS